MSWLLLDNFLRLGVGLFVGVWVARYLGPEQFGLLNYATALVAIATPFAALGLGNLLVRDMVKFPERIATYLGTGLVLRLGASLTAMIILLGVVRGTRADDWQAFWLVAISAIGMVSQSFDGLEFYYQSKVQSKYVVWSKNAAVVVSAVFKILAVVHGQSLVVFALIGLAELLVSTGLILAIYIRQGHTLFDWRWSWPQAKALLQESWPLIMGSAASLLNMRIGQVLIGDAIDNVALGNYSAAARISEIWLMVPGVIGASIFPSLIRIKQTDERAYRKRVLRIFCTMLVVSLVFASMVSGLADWLVSLLYGSQYAFAGGILSIHIWSGVPYMATFVFGSVFYIEKMTKLFFYSSLLAPFITIGASLLLIGPFGARGVAMATLVTAVFNGAFGMVMLQYKLSFFTKRG